jgi:hypothetical protein
MGQRANYIFKDRIKPAIHYHHWRANRIAADLYLGEKRFLEFVNQCPLKDQLLDEPWIEGCVIIDKSTKALFFWSFEFSRGSSVIAYYLNQLSKKWPGWALYHLKNSMYDIEKILGIDYIERQEFPQWQLPSEEEVIADQLEDEAAALVIIKDGTSLLITKTGNLSIKQIMNYGQGIISLLKSKTRYPLPKEEEDYVENCIVIEVDKKIVYINDASIGLMETCQNKWADWYLIFGEYGYIDILKRVGLETSAIVLSEERIKAQFSEMVNGDDDFDPVEFAKRIQQDHNDVQFNPDFFDGVKPRHSIISQIKTGIKKLFSLK